MTSVLLLASETSRSSAIFVSHSNPSCFLAAKATKTHSAQCLEKRLFQNLAVGYCIEGDGFGLHLRHCQEQLGRILLQDLPTLFYYLSMSFGIFPTFPSAKAAKHFGFYYSHGHDRPWVPFITTIFLFIFVSNWSGALIPWKLFEIPAGWGRDCDSEWTGILICSLMSLYSWYILELGHQQSNQNNLKVSWQHLPTTSTPPWR